MKFTKRLISAFALAGALAGTVIVSSSASKNNITYAAIHGIDVSSYNGGLDISKVSGDFAIVKATEGTGYVNPYFQKQVKETVSSGKLLGIYHYADGYDPIAEANHLLNVAGAYKGQAVYVLDFEGDLAKRNNVAWAKRFLDYVKSRTNSTPMIYMSLSVENQYNWRPVAAQYPLWVAQYNNYNPVYGYSPRSIYGTVKNWPAYSIFQYTSNLKLSGWNESLDGNVGYITPQQWNLYANNNKPASQAPRYSTPTSPVATVTRYAALRNAPNGKILKYLSTNSAWKVEGKATVNGTTWYNLGGSQWISGSDVSMSGSNNIKTIKYDDYSNKGGQTQASGSPVATIAYTAQVGLWDKPNGKIFKYLPQDSAWRVTGKSYIEGNWWYCLGGNQWILGKYAYVTGTDSIKTVSGNNSSSESKPESNSSMQDGNINAVGKVDYVKGYGIMIWGSPAYEKPLNRYLPTDSEWKMFKKTTVNGEVWYNLGGNQWILGKYIKIVK